MTGQEFKKLFGLRVRAIRSKHGMTQEQLAEKAQISLVYLGKIERGLASPSFTVIASLAGSLGVSPVDLFQFGEAA